MNRPTDRSIDIRPVCLPGVDLIAMSSDRSFPRHSHDQFGIGIMRTGRHLSRSACGQVEPEAGDAIAVSPNEVHDGTAIAGCRTWEMIFVEPETLARFVGDDLSRRELGFAVRRSPALTRDIERAFIALRDRSAAAAEEALTALFSAVLSDARAGGDRRPSPATLRVLARIHDRPESPPTLDEVAIAMGMHRTGALRRFRREVGATPHDYAMQLRLRLARRALAEGTAPAILAHDLGFADQSHLTRAFVRQFGLSPGRYRAAKGHNRSR